MTIGSHIESFLDLPIRAYEGGALVDPHRHAWRVETTYESEVDVGAEIAALAAAPGAERVRAIVIGQWSSESGQEPDSVVEALIAAAPRLRNLEGIFLGDVTCEECEISWLAQMDLGPLVRAYPGLRAFTARGGQGLRLSGLGHERLESLSLQAGGLPAEVVEDILAGRLPALRRLELWLGSDNYGGTTSVETLRPLLDGDVLPALEYLGLRNADDDLADAVAEAVSDAPILERLQTLDLSMGALTDAGAAALLDSPGVRGLRHLDLHHHYLTAAMQNRLRSLGISVDLSDAKDPDEEYRHAEVTE